MAWRNIVATSVDERRGRRAFIPVALAVIAQVVSVGCHRADSLAAAESLDHAACAFEIFWPPRDPHEKLPATAAPATAKPLLRGNLALDARQSPRGGAELRLVVTITRPSEEAEREFWNSQLAYADIAWMEEVRVWDTDRKWLWPNVPYLLRLPGQERIERYGGMDPGKHVDNDFAAVLIRKFDASGKTESRDTKDNPLVSAEWHAEGIAGTDLHTIVHMAKSDAFLLHLGGEDQPARGQLKVWLIYADFLGARPPRAWPKAREWAGGILAYFEIDWETSPSDGCRGGLRHKMPDESTGFNWSEWVVRTPGSDESQAQFRLSDTVRRAD